YSSYISWLESRDMEASKKFWQNYLAGYESLATLPRDRSGSTDFKLSVSSLVLNEQKTRTLRQVSSEHGVTLNTILQTAWGILLARYNNTNDVVFGTVVSGRPAELNGIETMVGLFINTIPVRINFDNDIIKDLLKKVQQDAIEGESNHYSPLSEIQVASGLGMALLDHILIFENYPIADEIEGENRGEDLHTVTDLELFEQSNYDFTLVVLPGDTIRLNFEYNSNRYSSEVIDRFKSHFEAIIDQVGYSNKLVSDIDILSSQEREKLLDEFNNTSKDYPREKTLAKLFTEQALRTPDNTALVFETQTMSYSALDARTNQLARHLVEKGCAAGTIVGLMVDRSIEMMIGILAILKAGATYLPIGIDQPASRVAHMLEDSNTKILITEGSHLDAYKDQVEVINVHDETVYSQDDSELNIACNSDQLAYIIYTSGSTGKPKGVMVCHRSVVNMVYSLTESYEVDASDRILQFSAITFDSSVEQIWLALLNGAALVLISRDMMLNTENFNTYISQQGVTQIDTTPTFLESIGILPYPALRRVMSGGEACSKETAWELSKYCDFYNTYGPTEATVTTLVYKYKHGESLQSVVPIGKPTNNTKVYIVDILGQLQPIGVPGELCIGGECLSLGYFNREELTLEKFVDNPYCSGEKIYKTGDLARWLPDGSIEYLGRLDDQVKIRGFRIELGEVERELVTYEMIKDAAVLVKEIAGDKYLVGYYVSDKELSTRVLRDHLFQSLPDYMVPAHYIHMDSFPTTSNGKVDRKALPDPEFTGGE
ncbi:non-ribosomal peptide synthetase, partial [Fulvivirga imtechensis]|uniref:non-ribosomal peptide synthetase n=1 Tax=Fulvivirga imtechensis TaxID=881893 RepID=UPI00058D65AB